MPSTGEAEKARSRRPSKATRAAILEGALRCFYEQGYHGASMRTIAMESDLKVGSIYNHFDSKQSILCEIMMRIMQDALAVTHSALLDAGPSPADQLRAIVNAWIQFHAGRRVEARVGYSELDRLDEDGRRRVVALRDKSEAIFRDVVERGAASGMFRTPHPQDATRAILGMSTAVSGWYHPGGSISTQELSSRYQELTLAMLGHNPEA